MFHFLGFIVIMFWLLGLLTSYNFLGFFEIIILMLVISFAYKVILKKFYLVEKQKS